MTSQPAARITRLPGAQSRGPADGDDRVRRSIRAALRSVLGASIVGPLIATGASAQSLVGIPYSATIELTDERDELVLLVDLGDLPPRPRLIAEATPPHGVTGVVFDLEVRDPVFAEPTVGACLATLVEPPGPPRNQAYYDFWWACYPNNGPIPGSGDFAGSTMEVHVSAPNFGTSRAPLSVSLEIRAETVVPTTSASVEIDPTAQATAISSPSALRDTTLWQRFPDLNDGASAELWVGTDGLDLGAPQIEQRRTLLSYDLDAMGVPASAQVEDAVLSLYVESTFGQGSGVGVRTVDTDPLGPAPWVEGDGDVFAGEVSILSSVPAASWLDREQGLSPWTTPGGDPVGATLASIPAGQIALGWNDLQSPALTAAVAQMVASGEDEDGFVLVPQSFPILSSAILIQSREDPGFDPPRLAVTYSGPFSSGDLDTNVRSFISEGQNFRWIYDLDEDGVYTTPVDGICSEFGGVDELPYTYEYLGSPSFVGVDCCTWQIDSPQTGTLGVGQVLFFHGLDPSDPEDAPSDTDQDGIADVCDNCLNTPNGPFLGTCLGGPGHGTTCASNLECGGATCSLSQEDTDGDGQGEACPEPGATVMLAIGTGALTVLSRGRSRRRSTARA